MKVSILIPCYNEIKTVEKIVSKILEVNLFNIEKEIIIVDDGSTDGTTEVLKNNLINKINKIYFHKTNLGKGSAIKTAISKITGDIIIIQDADMEYDPDDYMSLITPILKKKTKVVYGSRVLGKQRYNSKNFTSKFRIFANHFLTFLSNKINNQNLTDAHTCYKVFSASVLKDINLVENGFNFCPEITSKFSKFNYEILEVPISYNGRTSSEGKKISIYDGFEAIYTLIKYKFFN